MRVPFAESDLAAVIGAVAGVVTTMVVTAGGVVTAYLAYRVALLSRKVEEVHRATNSITDRLVAKTESEALARGGVEERARADSRRAEERGGQ